MSQSVAATAATIGRLLSSQGTDHSSSLVNHRTCAWSSIGAGMPWVTGREAHAHPIVLAQGPPPALGAGHDGAQRDLHPDLLPDLAMQRRLRLLPRVDLAARELPAPRQVRRLGALGAEQDGGGSHVIDDGGGHDVDPRRRVQRAAHPVACRRRAASAIEPVRLG